MDTPDYDRRIDTKTAQAVDMVLLARGPFDAEAAIQLTQSLGVSPYTLANIFNGRTKVRKPESRL